MTADTLLGTAGLGRVFAYSANYPEFLFQRGASGAGYGAGLNETADGERAAELVDPGVCWCTEPAD